MNKFLLVLLIAVVASATVQIDNGELKSWISKLKDKLKKFVKKLCGKLKDLYHWLKDNGFWDQIVDLAKQYAVPAAIGLCSSVTHLDGLCSEIVSKLASHIH